ncbi:MAG: hypothetical protein WB723_02640 [Candidatus Acidiferrales bacterium]
MRIRPSIFQVSSVLLTLGFLYLLPSSINCIRTRDSMTQIAGLAGLTLILVALIVIWTGVAAGNWVAWVIMAVIVWVWALPALMWPVLRHGRRWTLGELHEWVVIAWREDTFVRATLIDTVMFLLMLVGLVLPVRALYLIRKPE